LSLRFKDPRKDGDEYEAKSRELALELEVEILRETTEVENFGQPMTDFNNGSLGKRHEDSHSNGHTTEYLQNGLASEKKIKDE
jgi:hypothetical protein